LEAQEASAEATSTLEAALAIHTIVANNETTKVGAQDKPAEVVAEVITTRTLETEEGKAPTSRPRFARISLSAPANTETTAASLMESMS